MRSLKFPVVFISILILASFSFADVKFPAPKGFVNDFAGVLSPSQLTQLRSITSSLKQKNGSELAVVTVKSVAPLDPKMYAVKLFNKWGIGEKGKDNGVLLLLAMEERRVEIEVGYGLEGVLTDATCGRILDNYAVPKFKQGKMGEGLVAAAGAIAKVAAGEKINLTAESQGSSEGGLPRLFSGLIILSFAIAMVVLGFISLFKAKFWVPPIIFGLAGAAFGYLLGEIVFIIIFTIFGVFCGFAWAIAARSLGGGGGSSGGWSSGSSSSGGWSSGSSSSSSGSSSGGFSGGSSGGGGAGRGW